jgi:preprotein translocase subunit SecY
MQELLLSATFVGYTGCFYGIMVLKLTKLGFKSGYYPLRFHLMAGFLPVAFASSLFIRSVNCDLQKQDPITSYVKLCSVW